MDDSVVIELAPGVLSQKTLVENLTSISGALRKFLEALIELGNQTTRATDGNPLISRSELQAHLKSKGLGSSDSLISQRLRDLLAFDVSTLETHPQPGRRRLNHYFVKDLAVLASLPAKKTSAGPQMRRTKNMVRTQREMFKRDKDAITLQGHNNISIHFHERVFNGILDAAMRLSHRDTRKEIMVECQLAGKPLRITANCSSAEDSGIAVLPDQRAMRSIISYCKKEIARKKAALIAEHGESGFKLSMVPNLFHLDIHDLCHLLGMRCVNENLDNIEGMMRRLADTNFRVDATENEWFRENFSLLPGGGRADKPKSDTFEFRFLQNFEIAHENAKISDLFEADLSELRPRFYTFSLEVRMFYTLLLENQSNLFLSHEELATERSGIIQRFYNWARAFVSGRQKSGLNQHWYSMRDMYEHLTPAARFDNFRAYFMRALKKFAIDVDWQPGKSGKALVYGYYVFYERRDGEDMFRFERDQEDQIVGDNSRHNVLLRKQALEGLAYGE